MRHLTHEELLEALESGRQGRRGDGRPAWTDHLEACPRCRGEIAAMSAVFDEVSSLEMPEPSPLFWDQFSRRVSAATRESPSAADARPSRWGRYASWALSWRLAVPAGAVAIAVAVFALVGRMPATTPPVPRPLGVAQPETVAAADPRADADAAGSDDESWQVLSALASEADGAVSLVAPEAPGSAEGALLQLSDEERGELGRLLQAEIDGQRARVAS